MLRHLRERHKEIDLEDPNNRKAEKNISKWQYTENIRQQWTGNWERPSR